MIECIDQTLSELEICPALFIYSTAEKSFGVSKEEIPEKPEAFEDSLDSVLGSSSVKVKIEMKKLIVETFRLRFESIHLELAELMWEIMYGTNPLEEELQMSGV
jgi:hypothetical protein